MKAAFNATARKRPVILTLDENLVNQAKSLTDKVPGVVEELLSEFVARTHRHRIQRSKIVKKTVATWNRFNFKSGCIAAEYSSF